MISITDTFAVEQEGYLVFDMALDEALPFGQSITVAVEAVAGSARQGPSELFDSDRPEPFDFADQEFEFSLDDGLTWNAAEEGNQVTFGFGLIGLKVRLPINDDTLSEGPVPETVELRVTDVVTGSAEVGDVTATGTGSIIDDDGAVLPEVTIADVTAIEGEDEYAVLDIDLSASTGERTVLKLETIEGDARPGAKEMLGRIDQGSDSAFADPIDYADDEIEVSYNRGETWAVASNGQIEIPKGTVDLTQVRIAIGDDDIVEPDESFEVNVVNVVEGTVDAVAAVAKVTIVDDDTVVPLFSQKFQAEDAVLSGASVQPGRSAEGEGFVDYADDSGGYAEWIVNVPEAGVYELSWRYQNGSSNRPLALDVNGDTLNPEVDFDNTGGWSKDDWGFASQSVSLSEGANAIRLTTVGQSGANFDYMTVSDTGIREPLVVPIEEPSSEEVAGEETIGEETLIESADSELISAASEVSFSSFSRRALSFEPTTEIDAPAERDAVTGLKLSESEPLVESDDSLFAAPAPFARRSFAAPASFARQSVVAPASFAVIEEPADAPIAATQSLADTQPSISRSLAVQSSQLSEDSAPAVSITASNALAAPLFDVTLQAEEAVLSGPVVQSGRGSEGSGYADYVRNSGDYIEWTVDVPEAATYELSWRYQNGSGNNRPLALDVNGNTSVPSVDFNNTGGWGSSNWDFVSQSVSLDAGPNTIRLTAIGQSGGNLDYMRVAAIGTDVAISDAEATEGTDDYLVFDVSLSAASDEDITLDLAAIDGTAKGGTVADFTVDPASDPVDYAIAAFEVSTDGGTTWQLAANGTEVTFAAGETARKVRLAVNDDQAPEGSVAETLQLVVDSVIAGEVTNSTDVGNGSIVDNEISTNVLISDAEATEGKDNYLVFDVSLSAASNEAITLDLVTIDGTAKGGTVAEFTIDPAGDPVDYASAAFEVSADGGATWQAATNDTEVTFAAGETARKVRVAINDDQATEVGAAETLQLAVSSVVAGNVTNSTDVGNGSIVDNEVPDPGVPFETTLQAEDAVLSGPVVQSGRGSEGTGYADYVSQSGEYTEWTVDVPAAGTYELSWRYQNGSSGNRPLALAINGNTANPSVDFDNTGGWGPGNWNFVSQFVSLNAGPNTIRLTSIGQSGGNFDFMTVASTGTDVLISDATATEGIDDYLVFDVSLSAASDSAITLDLAAIDGTARGGNAADFTLDPAGDPVDYANAAFEVSTDGGATWQAAVNDTEITFAPGETERKVRLAINDDQAIEGSIAETLQLVVDGVIAGNVRDATAVGNGSIVDNELPTEVLISDATATEGTDDYLVFDVSLSAASDGAITLDLAAIDGTARGGNAADFAVDPAGDPVDYANAAFEVSTDGGATWQAAVNDTEITFAAGETERKVRLAINDDQATEGVFPETLQLVVNSVVAGEVTNATDVGIGSIIDNEIPDPGTPNFFDEIFQAEDAVISGPVVQSGRGSEGTGYVDYVRNSGDYTEWTVNAPAADVYELSWRYQNGSSNRPLALDINGSTINPGVDFENTGGWNPSNWDFTSQSVSLNAGPNTIRLTATGQSGANFDYMRVVATGTDVLISDAEATEGTDSYLVFDVSLSAASTEDVTLELTTIDGTAKGGAAANFADDLAGDPIDYANEAFEVSADGGVTWLAATGGNQVTFVAGETERKVRLAINDDQAIEGSVAETLQLTVGSVVSGSVRSATDRGVGSIIDDEIPTEVLISDAEATEGTDDYLVFDVSLSQASSGAITLDLEAIDGTAKGGAIADFDIDPEGDPVDYANAAFEVLTDNGWEAATNGTEITFAAGETARQVRLLVHDDLASEGAVAESLQLAVRAVLSGEVTSAADVGTGLIIDNEIPDPGTPPISTLPGPAIRVEGNVNFSFDGQDGGLADGDVDDIGFTMVDPSSNPGNPNPVGGVVGYWAEKLDVADGVLKINATSGLQARASNTLDNALGIGLNIPSKDVTLKTTLVDLPTAGGGFAQAGLWFGQSTDGGNGTSEDDYLKLVAISPSAGDYQLQALIEESGQITKTINLDIPDDLDSIDLQLAIDAETRAVRASYALEDGSLQTLTTFTGIPDGWFSFDQAGLNPNIATRSFGGILASRRFAGSEQVFSFEEFLSTEGPVDLSGPGGPGPDPDPDPDPDPPSESDLAFDKWQIPIGQTTAMALGPDGKLYVATIFGTIKVFDVDPETRTFTEETIQTIKTDEGGNRLTLGIAVDPDSTPDNVILWVGHSDGSIQNGAINSGKVSRLSGPDFSQKDDIMTGMPRAIANHALNNIDFGPDGNLYLWYGGNTGAGSANTTPTEFGDRPEQNLAAALLKLDVQSWKADPSSFHTDASSPIGEFLDEFYDRKELELGREFTELSVYATGLRNTYDGVFHSNGNIYAPDNGLGALGSTPPVPRLGDPTDRSITTLFGDTSLDNPGVQTDSLNRIVEGGYYGHPNPYRDEVVFKTGAFQGFSNADSDPTNDIPEGHPDYTPPFLSLGTNLSANGIVEYTADNFFGQLKGDLLLTSFSKGDNVIRVQITEDGLAPVGTESLIGGLVDPLPIVTGQNGTELEGLIFVGEFNGGNISVFEPLGTWRDDLPSLPNPLGVLDAGSAVLDGQLYMVGGKTSTGHISDVYVYTPGDVIDASDDTWTTLPSTLPGAAVENPAVIAYDGKLYTFGGSTGPFSGAVGNAAVYDPATAVWTALADMPTARGGAQAAVINDTVYVVGGLGADGASVDTVEAYDLITGEWLSGAADPAELQTRRDNAGIAVIDDKLHVFGGRIREVGGNTPDGGLVSMEIYDPLTDQWTFGASMLNGRRTMAVGTINGNIQAIGGEGNALLDISEEYVPSLGAWRSLPSITTGRHGAAFGTIDGVVYVAGGGPTAGSAFTDVTEAFTF